MKPAESIRFSCWDCQAEQFNPDDYNEPRFRKQERCFLPSNACQACQLRQRHTKRRVPTR